MDITGIMDEMDNHETTMHLHSNRSQWGTASRSSDPFRTTEPAELNGRLRVLVVDNEEAISILLSRILALEGYKVACVPNGQAALAKIQEAHYDAIICNLRMPEMDGLTFYRKLRYIDPDQALRVIFCTGLAISDAQPLLLGTGRRVLLKPFQINEVHDMVRSVIGDYG
jgi:CheY-like chemotaxis protein